MDMEDRIAKELDIDSNQRILLKAKRRQAGHAAFSGNAACAALDTCNAPTEDVSKRQKLDGFNGESVYHERVVQNSIVRYYSNFMKTGIPQRLMFYQDGEWTDFSRNAVSLLRKDLQMKKAAIEVELNGYHLLLDFLHMSCVDLETGSQQPIAWIDEDGSCFFPEIFASGKHEDHLYGDFSVPRELKLQLEIDINGVDVTECSGDSNTLEDNMQDDQKPAGDQLAVAVEGGFERVPDRKRTDAAEVNQQVEANSSPVVKPIDEELDLDFVRTMFLVNMTAFAGVDIVDLQRCSSSLGRTTRFELFQKQAAITEQLRGDANIRYAWLAVSSRDLSLIMTYGIGASAALTNMSVYGSGVHLVSVNWPNISVNYCDADEDGVRHMVLCRVIMGSMERVPSGSRQVRPSSVDFDSGVNDTQNPTHCIVWTMNANTHINPECVVSFKLPLAAEGNLSGRRINGPTGPCEVDASIINVGNNGEPGADNGGLQRRAPARGRDLRVPRSPWLPFPILFNAISVRVSPGVMDIIMSNYNLYRANFITRDAFVQKLRALVGDDLLRSTILALHAQLPPNREAQVVQNVNGFGGR